MNITGKVAVVTGAAGGIGLAVATELARRGAKAVAMVDRTEQIEEVVLLLNDVLDRPVAEPMVGDTTDSGFRQQVFDLITGATARPTSASRPRATAATRSPSRSTPRPDVR